MRERRVFEDKNAGLETKQGKEPKNLLAGITGLATRSPSVAENGGNRSCALPY